MIPPCPNYYIPCLLNFKTPGQIPPGYDPEFLPGKYQTIMVTTACTCGRRWFYCQCGSTVIAEYDCPTHEDGVTIYQEMIDEVRARHPGRRFIF